MAPPGKYTLSNHDVVSADIRDSMISILKNWDDNDCNNAYLRYFTPNATLVFSGPKIGRNAIRAARDSMIHPVNGPIVQCTHFLDSGFVNPNDKSEGNGGVGEIAIKATVTYDLTNGKKVVCPVVSLGKFVRGVDEEWCQAEHYEVFMDTTELGKAIGEMLGQA